jgi:hypothetical protein
MKGVTMRKVLVLACILALLASAAALVGCGSGSSGSSSQTPEQVMQAFWAAAKKGDANGSWNMLSAGSQKALKDKSAWEAAIKPAASSGTKFTVGKTTINGNKATVDVTVTPSGGKGQTTNFPLVKENGVWKVDMATAVK